MILPEPITFIIVLLVGIVASMYGILVGGTSLLTIPTLIFLGMTPATAIATNRTALLGHYGTGWYNFHRKGKLNYRIGWRIAIPALLGAIIGANLVFTVDETILTRLVGFLTLSLLFLMMVKKDVGLEEVRKRLTSKHFVIGMALSFVIGIYGGFYGAGSGTFLTYLLVLLFGLTMIQGAATRIIASLSLTAMATVVFVWKGAVVFSFFLALLIGSFIGSYIGSAYAHRLGNVWIKRLFMGIVTVMSLNLLFF